MTNRIHSCSRAAAAVGRQRASGDLTSLARGWERNWCRAASLRFAPAPAALVNARSHRVRLVLAFFAVYIMYGAQYYFIAVTVRHGVPEIAGGGARFMLVGIVLLIVLAVRKEGVRIGRRSMLATFILGNLLLSPYDAIAVAERQIASGTTAVLLATAPLMVLLLRWAFERERLSWRMLTSVLVGLGGVFLIVSSEGGHSGGSLLGLALVVFAAVCIAGGIFLAGKLVLPSNGIASAAWQLVWAGLVSLCVALARGELAGFHPSSVTNGAALAFLYLVVGGTLVNYVAYVWLLANVPISHVAAANYVNPLVAVAIGATLGGEALGLSMLAGGSMILASVAVTITQDRPTSSRAAQMPSTPAARPVLTEARAIEISDRGGPTSP